MKARITCLVASMACGCALDGALPVNHAPDLVFWDYPAQVQDLAPTDQPKPPPQPCEPDDPACHQVRYGPESHEFPLESDAMRDPLERDIAVRRDLNGYLKLALLRKGTGDVWIPNTQ